jgi:hypothetical protein
LILSYNINNERALNKKQGPFERAKAEWLKHAKSAIAEVYAL